MKIKTLLLFVIANITCLAQSDSLFNFKFLPSGNHFNTFKTNTMEARLGLQGNLSNYDMKIDIGNNTDIIEFNFPKDKIRITVGMEFLAYAWSQSYDGARLQIGAIDGFFGGNATVSIPFSEGRLLSRFRIIHNSSHFVDGYWDKKSDFWINGERPPGYARDLLELTMVHELPFQFGLFRYYGGGSYSVLIRPQEIKRWMFNSGFEFVRSEGLGKVFDHELNLFLSYSLVYSGEPGYKGSNNLMLGTKFGNWFGKGLVFYLSYYSGYNYFHAFYNKILERTHIGFQIDL